MRGKMHMAAPLPFVGQKRMFAKEYIKILPQVYHRLWFKRKSLVCDLVEPFRCIIDRAVRTSFHRKQFSSEDFDIKQGEYILKRELSSKYQRVFFDALIPYKKEVYLYVQAYYRCFMRMKSVENYPQFIR